ncbi:MAG: peptide/nickel transport system substrate-binding protein [Chloroflexota bacterium]|jgi:peptide/nickel transport system substrate-binding protein|nr:peptide/nickel transport system substrate-binding protein [Chloroflexota bacterium]
MGRKSLLVNVIVVLSFLAVACAPQKAGGLDATPAQQKAAAPKRIVAAIMGNANTVVNKMNPANYVAGIDTLQLLTVGFLVRNDRSGNPVPQLAQDVPSLQNGLWKLLPDGGMETTWKLRPNATWHDGTPMTAEDLAFTYAIARDAEIPTLFDTSTRLVDSVEVIDPTSIKVHYKGPFIDADKAFPGALPPLPKHLLEATYLSDKTALTNLPYWSSAYVGSGPFKVKEFLPDKVTLTAYDQYVLGRPLLEEVEVQFITDPNTLSANLLAGSVDLTLGRTLSFDQAKQLVDHWSGSGRMLTAQSWSYNLYAQMLDPDPQVLANAQFRKALYVGMDREGMIEANQPGTGTVVPTTILPPNHPELQSLETEATRYGYDPRRAAQQLEGLGFQKGADGFYRDANNSPLEVPILSSPEDAQWKLAQTVASQWQALGVKTSAEAYPPQRASDAEYINTRPGFILRGGWNGVPSIVSFLRGSDIPLPANKFNGLNVSRYTNSNLDTLIGRYQSTIPVPDRMQVASQMVRIVEEDLPTYVLFFRVEPTLASSRLIGVVPEGAGYTTADISNQAQLWDVTRA